MTMVLVLGAAAAGSCGGSDGQSSRSGSTAPDGSTSTTRSGTPHTVTDPTGNGEARTGSLDWEPCGSGAECSTLEVPLDHSRPRGEKIILALAVHRAEGERIGPLLVNPGGPGASGLYLAKEAGSLFPDEILDRFDVVAWDPRGVGESTPVDCIDDLSRFWAADRSPDGPAEIDELEAVSVELAEGCRRRSANLIAHVSSYDTAADMDLIREALGEEQVSYLGFSYGTFIGALYADTYPEGVRAMVLDGAIDPSLDPVEMSKQQAAGFDAALAAFFDDCAADEGCDFHSGGSPETAYARLMAQIDAETLPAEVAGEERELTSGEAEIGVALALYSGRDGWPVLAEALVEAARGDGSGLLELSDAYTGRRAGGVYSDDNEAFFAISCTDAPAASTADGFPAVAAEVTAAAPYFGATTLWLGLPCAYWPVPPVGGPTEIHATGAPPLLVLGTTNDPATPLAWAESLASQLDSGALAVLEGEGHTAFGRGSGCIDEIVFEYLVDLVVPDDGVACPA